MNTKNLLKLADFIENEITDEQFDMGDFRANENGDDVIFKSTNDCGTIGCALGWAPFVKGLEHLNTDKKYSFLYDEGLLDFNRYSLRVFGDLRGIEGDKVHALFDELGADTWDLDGLNPFTMWDFIFSDEWSKILEENTRHATANRIRTVCEGLIR